MKKLLSIIIAGALCISLAATSFAAPKFEDVSESDWFYNDVISAVELGLINGKSETEFKPDDFLTYAEALKLAACMNQLYQTSDITLAGGDPWYMPYAEYCKENKITQKDYNYDEYATRAGYMEIFANALPDEAFKQINNIPDGSISDVDMKAPYVASVYKLYRAGIVAGVDEFHNCNPSDNIKRCEVATIIARMMDESKRVKFEISDTIYVEPVEKPEIEVVVPNQSYNGLEVTPTITPEITPSEIPTTPGIQTETGTIIVTPSTPYDPGNTQIYLDLTKDPVKIKTQPENVEADDYSAPVSLVVEATDGTGIYTYQWKYVVGSRRDKETFDIVDSDTVSGATTNTLTFYANSNETLMGVPIYCTVTDANASTVNSNTASVYGPFLMNIEEYTIGSNEYTLIGRLSDGWLRRGDKLSIERNGKIIAIGEVKDIQMFNKSLDEAKKGDYVGIVFKVTDGVTPHDGDVAIRHKDNHKLDLSDIVN